VAPRTDSEDALLALSSQVAATPEHGSNVNPTLAVRGLPVLPAVPRATVADLAFMRHEFPPPMVFLAETAPAL